MKKGLEGKRIVLSASRKIEEMCTLVEKQGGIPLVRSAQGTVFLSEEEVEPDIRRVVLEGTDWMIFTTGIGTEALLSIAENIGLRDAFRQQMEQAKIAIRGYKTLSVLKKIGISPAVYDDDGTTQGVIRALEPFDLKGQRVVVQLYGDTAPKLKEFLIGKGAIYSELLPYKHVAPEPAVMDGLCKEIIEGKVDAVCFTTAMQVRFLFHHAKEKNNLSQLLSAFERGVLAVAVGKVTAEALNEEGVDRVIAPETQRMGAMIMELAQYYLNEAKGNGDCSHRLL